MIARVPGAGKIALACPPRRHPVVYRIMLSITINGRRLSAAPEQTILDAARAAGIDIPTLCWYPTLPIVGNCRICLVSVEGQPKLLPACATKVAEGMVVTTESHAAVENRKGVLRFLLERYPGDHLLDGGQADPRNEFEQYVVRYGVTPSPAAGRDLPLRSGDERPGDPMIQHDMTTCILCTRCVRACEDLQVVGVLDVAERGGHAAIIVGADGDPDRAGCTWCGECVRVCPTGAIFEVMPRERFRPEQIRRPETVVRSVCPYCGVGCQLDLHTADGKIVRVTSPDIELDTPNQGSTCVKGRFGYDFPQHRDRLTRPLIRRGWERGPDGRWVYRGAGGAERRAGPWRSIEGEGQQSKPGTPPRKTGKSVRELPLLERLDMDIRDRVATPASWYEPFREASWEEALELAAQELGRIKHDRGPDALACFSSAKKVTQAETGWPPPARQPDKMRLGVYPDLASLEPAPCTASPQRHYQERDGMLCRQLSQPGGKKPAERTLIRAAPGDLRLLWADLEETGGDRLMRFAKKNLYGLTDVRACVVIMQLADANSRHGRRRYYEARPFDARGSWSRVRTGNRVLGARDGDYSQRNKRCTY